MLEIIRARDRSGSVLTRYLRAFIRHEPGRACLSVMLTIGLGLTHGVGLLMLIPFLALLGIGETGTAMSKVAGYAVSFFEWFGLPFSLLTILCLYVTLVAIHAAATRYQAVLNTRITFGFTQGLRNRLYQALCQASWNCFLEIKASDITHILTNDLQRVGFATQQLLQLIGALVIAAVHIGVALLLSVPLTLFALACGLGFLLLLRPLNRRANLFGRELRQAMNDLYGVLSEHLSGMKVAKSLSLERQNQERFQGITQGITTQMVRFTSINAGTRMFYEIGAALALAGFFLVAVRLAQMPAAELLLIVFVFARLLPRFSMIQQTSQRIGNALPSFQAAVDLEARFQGWQEPPEDEPLPALKLEQGIRFSRVCFRYSKQVDTWAIKGLDLEIAAGQTTAVVGASGAGKSTLADLILGLLSPECGSVCIDGQPLTGPLLQQWRRAVGYVPQEAFLFHDSIRSNLLWACPRAGEGDIWQALEQASAKEFVSLLPEGLETTVGDRGVRLSGGERQRIALARALLRRPTLLLLDEATSSLDAGSQAQIQNAIRRLHGRMTIVVIAHRFSSIQDADQIAVLEQGRLVEAGAWQELQQPDCRVQQLFGSREVS